jgi:hypothetical protein
LRQRRLLTIAAVTLAAALALAACGDDDGPDFAVADLERLNFAPNEVPNMEYQPDSSGPGAFAAAQREQGDEGGVRLVDRLEELGLEADYVSQFFAASRGAETNFVESVSFLFEDDGAAEEAVDVVSEASASNIEPAEEIEAPDLGEQPFAQRGEFDGFLTYSVGWRTGDVIELVTVAPGDQKAGPESTIELAEQLESKANE